MTSPYDLIKPTSLKDTLIIFNIFIKTALYLPLNFNLREAVEILFPFFRLLCY